MTAMSDPNCPICGGAMSAPRPVDVCNRCHGNLHLATTAAVVTTGEFAIQDVLAQAQRAHTAVPTSTATVACTWCGRGADQVRKLLSRGDAHICNACVGFCADIMSAELGDDWRQ